MTSKYIKLVKYIGDADLRNFVAMCNNCHNSFNITHPTLSNYSQVFVVPEYLCYVGAVTCPNCGRENIIVFNTLENTRFPIFSNTMIFPKAFIENVGNLLEIYSLPYDEVMRNYAVCNINVFTSAILNAVWEQILIASNQDIAKKNAIKELAYFEPSTYKNITICMLSRIINNCPLPMSDRMLELKNFISMLICLGLDDPSKSVKCYKLFLTLNRELRKGTIQFTWHIK